MGKAPAADRTTRRTGPGRISRRKFLGYTAVTGAAAAAGPALPTLTGSA